MAETEETAEDIKRDHYFHAEATHTLSGILHLPLVQVINPQASAQLPEAGGYLSQQAQPYKVESVISYESAHTQVAGNKEVKPGHGWSTLVTSVVEGLNILDVVTADRVVGQVSTEYPLKGYVPSITFLGTRFENLRIAGHPVKLDWDLNLCGNKPDGDAPYTKSSDFVNRVSKQHANLRAAQPGHENPLAELLARYNLYPESFANSTGDEENVECSLVNKAEGDFPGTCCGHVIQVPNFGTIHLAVLRLKHGEFKKRNTHSGENTFRTHDDRDRDGMRGSGWDEGFRYDRRRTYKTLIGFLLLFALLAELRCRRLPSTEAQYNRISQMFLHGRLADAEQLAAALAIRFHNSNPPWSTKFTLLQAEAASWRGRNQEAINALSQIPESTEDTEITIQRLSIMGVAYAHLHNFQESDKLLAQAQEQCSITDSRACGEFYRSLGGVAGERGKYQEADLLYQKAWLLRVNLDNVGMRQLH